MAIVLVATTVVGPSGSAVSRPLRLSLAGIEIAAESRKLLRQALGEVAPKKEREQAYRRT